MPSLPCNINRIEFGITTEQAIADSYRTELDQKLRELAAIMNTALEDGFTTSFTMAQVDGSADGDFYIKALALTKKF